MDCPARGYNCTPANTCTRTMSQSTVNDGTAATGGCGKSTLLETFEKIFSSALEKPQAGSTFAISGIVKSDIILWQDYEHDEKILRISDLCSLLAGESVGIRKPGKVNKKYRNVAPCFCTGRAQIAHQRVDKKAEAMYNGMIDERFVTFRFANPLPKASRKIDFPQCGRCCAALFGAYPVVVIGKVPLAFRLQAVPTKPQGILGVDEPSSQIRDVPLEGP